MDVLHIKKLPRLTGGDLLSADTIQPKITFLRFTECNELLLAFSNLIFIHPAVQFECLIADK